MKNKILIFFLTFIFFSCYSQNYNFVKVAEFDNSNTGLPVREPWDIGDDGDATGNYICFTEDGELYVQNWDRNQLLRVNLTDYSLEVIHDLNFLQYGRNEQLVYADKEYYLFESPGHLRTTLVDKNFNKKYFTNHMRVKMNEFAYATYYDIDTNILFFLDRNKRELCSIVHPSNNLEQNKNNIRNHEETVAMLQNKTDVDIGDLKYNDDNGLVKGNREIYLEVYIINDNKNINIDNNSSSLFVIYINNVRVEIPLDENNPEELESKAYHPSGDLYTLCYNRTEKRHILYRVENTWDPAWRKQWYKEHK